MIADIQEGTDEETLNNYVGHFEETSKYEGNVGLAAHNRGYKVNYFARLKELEKMDIIIYQYGDITRFYQIYENKIIQDTDWSYLEDTCCNTITLITCVEDQPEFRRCVQAKLINLDGRENNEQKNNVYINNTNDNTNSY